MNEGEKSEIILKAMLLKFKDENTDHHVLKKITQLSDDSNLSELHWKSNADAYLRTFDAPNLVKVLGISKSRTSSKADVTVNKIKYSVKEINASPPAIINHTTRPKFETVCCKIGVSITTLDKIISNYWILRQKGKIKEDTKISDKICPFNSHKAYLKPIIEYFLFTGTGQGDSKYTADKIIEINYKKLPDGLRVFEKDDYFNQVWGKLVFSIRSKGMPPNYPNCINDTSISKWTQIANGKNKGSLHIRIKE